ncbi:2-succinyl-6-hydroxy-2,4-cyclohexadiene-1-carboxylate synthase [Waterburya agarophytonicola K14]|uniref:Putative 2-succinyl-6-hydroxy-2,4-cyclohexadiene-1-carboxylate synthase n=2 Tax=Waterburya TaxID=2886915 RepID=A0A964BQK0_9CYAN|nr:2-succinyl-6-hydroxy-2,4-cyclohexadiene-1-carboxylate synthase [Waterburya agarophytonicola]MCC0177585.1 2-succinyl-6-hydroxy-2,4-cyclohexadiene-1-carboxylate synthase [Waterburya agarophytonicola KI4]
MINYVLIGDRNKPVILFLHGFMGSCEDFGEVINLLNKDFCCLSIDLPGHGKTEVKSDLDYYMPKLAVAIIQLLEQLSIPQCFLVGYSMGGRLALYLAIYFPQYFPKVILESASPGLKTKAERKKRIKQDLKLANKLETENFAFFLQQWYQNPLFTFFIKHPNYPQAIARRLNNNPHKLAKSLRYMGLGAQPCLWEQLEFIRVPILLIVGELDPKFVAINQKINSLSPLLEIEIVKLTGHNVHFEQPIKFSQLLIDFLTSNR